MPTTPERDRFMDLVRVVSLLVVVAGHWLVIIPYVRDGVAGGRMLYDVAPGFWFLTWIFQVIPLFFFVGGFANLTVYRALEGPRRGRRYLSVRLHRLLVPTLVFLAFLLLLEGAFHVLDLGGSAALRGMRVGEMAPFAQLWFLGVYLLLVVLAPVTIRLHRLLGAWAVVALLLAVLVTDVAAFGLHRPHLLGVNILLVWLVPHQLGHLYADGRLARLSPARLWAVAWVALVVLLVLTSLPVYGRNLLDNGVTVAGITAPTLPFAAASISLIAAALAVRRPVAAWLEGARAWRVVAALNRVAMTLFLWHLVAYYAIVLALDWTGLPLPAGPDLMWWLERPLYLLLPAIPLALLALVFGRFERRARGLTPASAPPAPPAGSGIRRRPAS